MTKVVAAPASGDEGVGKTITLTLDMSEAVTVAGTPTLTLNDGGTANYTGGSGTNALTFSYTVGAGEQRPALAMPASTSTARRSKRRRQRRQPVAARRRRCRACRSTPRRRR